MKLNFRDIIATILVAFVVGFLYKEMAGAGIPFISSPRFGIVVLLALGVGMCATGSRLTKEQMKSPYAKILGAIGGLAAIIAVIGLITNGNLYFEALGVILIAMWMMTTARHALAK